MKIETFFPYRLAVTAEAFSRQLVAVYAQKYYLSREEWRLLFLLDEAETVDSVQISQRTSLDKVQVSRAASRLESKELITRSILDIDRRLREYRITAAGALLFRQVFEEVEARANDVLYSIPETERAALMRGIEALDQAIASMESPDKRSAQVPLGKAEWKVQRETE